MKPEPPGHRDITVNVDRQLRFAKDYAEGKSSPYENASRLIAITRRAIEKANESGVDTAQYEKEFDKLVPAIKIREVKERISKLAEILKNPYSKSGEDIITDEAKIIIDEINALKTKGVDTAEVTGLFLGLSDRRKTVK